MAVNDYVNPETRVSKAAKLFVLGQYFCSGSLEQLNKNQSSDKA